MIVAIIQARMGSTRLPGKVLLDVAGKPMLWRVYDRVSKASGLDQIVVATSKHTANDPIAKFCIDKNIHVFRGSESDVLDRFFFAATKYKAHAVVRITADCPLVDPKIIERVIGEYKTGSFDYVANNFTYSYPNGLDVEVFSMSALEQAFAQAKKPAEREHVTPFIRSSGQFKTANVANDTVFSGANFQWSVDDAEDLEFIRNLCSATSHCELPLFEDFLEALEKTPSLRRSQARVINEGYYKSIYQAASLDSVRVKNLSKSKHWLERSKKVTPGCAQTVSKGYTQYVQGIAPVFLQKGRGCRVWDVDGNEYIDYVQGLLPNILGYAHPDVNSALSAQLNEGCSFSLPHPLEVELAETLCEIIPSAEMVRFGKNGSDVTAGAVRIARAFTGRDRIACSGYHGWQDWYIGTTHRNLGVPNAVKKLTHPFVYNDSAALEKLFAQYPDEFAAVIMEPVNFTEPAAGYLESVKSLAHKHGALLIFDEMCTGFHFGLGGAQKKFNVTPDLSCFGKAMGNGYPISCVVGRRDVMSLFDQIFFSFTFAGDVLGFSAALKVIEILRSTDVLARIEEHGRILKDGFNTFSEKAGLQNRLVCVGYPNWTLMRFMNEKGQDATLEKSLFQQEAIKRGLLVLATHNLSGAHTSHDIELTLEVYAKVFKALSHYLSDPRPERHLEGLPIEPIFKVR